MALETKTRLRLAFWFAMFALSLISVGLALADAGIPAAPPDTPWQAWLFVSVMLSGAILLTAVMTARRQGRRAAIDEYARLHAEERQGRKDCEERGRSQQAQIDAQQTIILKVQTQNQRYKISIHKLRTTLQQIILQSGFTKIDGLSALLGDDDDADDEVPANGK